MKNFIVFAIYIVFSVFKTASAQDFSAYQELLNKFLKEEISEEKGLRSAFDYDRALAQPQALELVKKQKQTLSQYEPAVLRERASFIAFWVNAYNFFMLAQILENPTAEGKAVSGVRDFRSLFDYNRVFKLESFQVGEKFYSLDQIEKGTLLGSEASKKGYKDARVHFAVNCASVGCPALRQQIYTAENIEQMLTENTTLALKTRAHYERKDDTLYLTRLFKWYEKDFTEDAGSNLNFLLKYVSEIERAILKNEKLKIKYRSYDWSLNSPENIFIP